MTRVEIERGQKNIPVIAVFELPKRGQSGIFERNTSSGRAELET